MSNDLVRNASGITSNARGIERHGALEAFGDVGGRGSGLC